MITKALWKHDVLRKKEHAGCLSNTMFIQFFSCFIATSRVSYCG